MSSKPANYAEFFDLPTTWTRAQWGEKPQGGDRALLNDADPYKWSGDGIPPKIGAKVHCYLNGIGPCTVLKYFVEYGWLGIIAEVKKNPAWRKKQDNGVNVPAHLFGLDLEPRKPIVPVTKANTTPNMFD
jgi:hypothetical protein